MTNGNDGKRGFCFFITAVILFLAWYNFIENHTYPVVDIVATPQIEADPAIEEELIVVMIDVRRIDSYLFQQNGKSMLINCGTRTGGNTIVKYLKKLGITKLDYVFGTYIDDEYMGGMYEVITNFEIGKIIIPEEVYEYTESWYIKLMDKLKTGEYNVEYARLGTTYNLGVAKTEIYGQAIDCLTELTEYFVKVSFEEFEVVMTGNAEGIFERNFFIYRTNNDETSIIALAKNGAKYLKGNFEFAINP